MFGFILNISYLILALCTDNVSSYSIRQAQALFGNITSGYNVLLRPSRLIRVDVELSVMSVNVVDVKQQIFSVTGYLTVSWDDPRLSWAIADNGDIPFMFLTEDYVWKPELVIQNSAHIIPIIDNDKLSIRVRNSGNVMWQPPGIYVVTCDVDITYYPFDTQICYIAVSTWTHDNTQITLLHSSEKINLAEYNENGEWSLVNNYVEFSTTIDQFRNDQHRVKLLFTFELKRKIGYYILNMLLPPMLTSFLGLMVFLLPVDSGEKVGFSITVLLALAVLLTITSDYIPSTSKDTSIYGVYLLCNMLLSALGVVLTTFVLRVHHSADQDIPVSHGMQRFANTVLARISCYDHCCKITDGNPQLRPKRSQINPSSSTTTIVSTPGLNNDERESAHMGHWREYSWQEIAAMMDKAIFYIMLTIWAVFTVVFTTLLASN